MTRRRSGVAAALVGACIAVHAHDDDAAAAARIPQRAALLARAQAELERGDATQALDDFERAAMMLHAADAELGLIRAAMQDGQYRRALAFCAHTAGEHTDDADGGALYAWLLRVGGQASQSDRVLADARAHTPDAPVTRAAGAALALDPPVATGLLLTSPHRMAPWPSATGGPVPPAARFASNAVLVDDGRAALVPLAALAPESPARLWVRNGLGQAVEASRADDAALAARGLARLRLHAALPVGASRESAGRAPFAGSPGYSLRFGDTREPAWPMLTQGFLGGLAGAGAARRVGFDSAPGAPVLDAGGALVGITLGTTRPQAAWLPLSDATSAPAAPASTAARAGLALVAPDEIYEAGLRRALQVLVEPRRASRQ